jgi:glyoxylase-like metal-dependent hydrolase (beta-lactamase superfamily II)
LLRETARVNRVQLLKQQDGRCGACGAIFAEDALEERGIITLNRRDPVTAIFLIRRPSGNVMVDAPRWTKPVMATLEAWGGLSAILLTHQDDVADAGRYAAHFDANVWIHEADRRAAGYADQILTGREPVRIDDGLLATPVPGHTEGSVVYLYDQRCLFTGDSLAWSFERSDLVVFRDACWFSWSEQTRSLRRLLNYRLEWVFAGHGGSQRLPTDEMHARLTALLNRMA